MKNAELRALRRELDLPTIWCARHVGRVAERTWKYWEAGRNDRETVVPVDVQARMLALRKAMVAALK